MGPQPLAATVQPADDDALDSEGPALDVVALATLVAIAAGLMTLTTGPLAWDAEAARAGVFGQLGETLPAAVLVLGATALNLAAGGVLARLALGRPFDGFAGGILAATVGAVLLDTALLFALGGAGLFRAPVLLGVHVAILGGAWLAGTRVRPLATPGSIRLGAPGLPWAIVGLLWFGAFVLQLASPVVPFLDVLPNHVAPVERLRTFGEFAVLTESPSPIYGPSRTFLGYVGWLGTIATMTGLPAGLAVSAFILPASILIAVAVHRLATAIAGPGVGVWAVIAFALTASFGRLTDARATVLVLPVAFAALAFLAERLPVQAPPAADETEDAAPPPSVRDPLLLGAALGAAVLVHPVVGALTVATVGIVVLLRSEVAALGVPAIAVAAALALPQAAAMLGFAVPSIAGLLVVIPALVLGRLLATELAGLVAVVLGRAALLTLVPLGLAGADLLVSAGADGISSLAETMPLLVIGAIAGLVLAPRVAGHPVVLGGIAAGIAVGAATQLVPEGGGLLSDSIRFELPKTLHYWVPLFAALATAIGLVALWRADRLALPLRAALVAVFLIVAAMPLRNEEIDDHHLGEHRLSETLAVDLRFAGSGYWHSYPDARQVVDAPRVALLDALRAEIAAGRINGSTDLLHVAATFQQWEATPIGVFTGIRETVVAPDAEETIHTVGGRLRPLDRLDELLAGGAFEYVVVEPGDGVPPDASARVLAAGYRSIYANERGEVYDKP